MSAGNSEFTAEFFDESSRAWMENKKRHGDSMVYKCDHVISKTRRCNNTAKLQSGEYPRRCNIHKQRTQE